MSDGGAAVTAERCGHVAILGAPNAGKSTLVNTLVGAKVSIVTHKVQTTRGRVTGVCNVGRTQIVLVDTPGIFQPRKRLERALVKTAWSGAVDADATLLVIDARRGLDDAATSILSRLTRHRHVLCAINKIDLVQRDALLPLAGRIGGHDVVEEIFYISALNGDGVDDVVSALAERLPIQPWLFPADHLSDQPLARLAAEITREKLFVRVHQELPYELSVETELWTDIPEEEAVRIDQVIYVARRGHKPIVLGRNGHTIREVGKAARRELETLLECRVHLFLHVKVRTGWLDDPARYREIGLEFPG
ncbi:MAG: GTPase Era [Alphaproteobacteria bacterium]|nr:GTPase Era [Alphaproteobacteria bacterium]